MSGFKLLAIRPLEDCDKQFLKNLKPGMVYKFYQDYNYYIGEDLINTENYDKFSKVPISKVEALKSPLNIYSENGLEINISAIVGKNGSGKSALTELFFLALYVYYFKNIVAFQLTKNFESTDFIILDEDLKTFCKRIEQSELFKKNSELKSEFDLISNKIIKIEIIFALDNNTVYSLAIDNTIKNEIKSIFGEKQLDEIPFYTIVTNYSLFGLNHLFIGNWIQSIFHKNDAYQTPIVLNPKREDSGFIDIENESSLQQNRLLLNLFEVTDDEALSFLFNNKKITKIKFELIQQSFPFFLKKEDTYHLMDEQNLEYSEDEIRIFKQNISKALELGKEYDELSEIEKNAFNDLARKIMKTSITYNFTNEYKSIFEMKNLKNFKNKSSHIFFKINQTVNFIKEDNFLKSEFENNFPNFTLNSYYPLVDNFPKFIFYLNLFNLKNKIKNKEISDRLNFLPPPIFKWDIKFSDTGSDSFNNMSSGEKQLIYVIQTVVYHVRNILSSEIGKREYINLVFDEIELYFHPDYQRQFIKKLIDSLNLFFGESKLKFNILFLTHSPFILSDIPSNNILCLEDGKSKEKLEETFAANVHDLLAHKFFLNDGFIGEFAKEKIKSLIDFLDPNKIQKTLKQKTKNRWNLQNAEEFIEIIGEPFLKSDLQELLIGYKKRNFGEKEWLEDEIKYLTRRLKNLEK